MRAAAPPAPHLAAPLLALAASSPDAEATRCGGRVRSRGALAARVAALAHALRAHLGVQDGAVVALCAQSTDALLEAWLAVAAAGGIAAPLNTRWCGSDAILRTSAPRSLAAAPGRYGADVCGCVVPQEHG
jgi:acyl-CoA synthetase (AMP-forming)/AMP-acid ligase II